jgi:hypothetical protein
MAGMQPTAFTPEGQPVPQEEMDAAVKEGRASFEKGKRVYAKNEGGSFVTIPAEDAGLPSYRLLTDDQIKQERLKADAGSAGGMAKTALEGAVRGPSFGYLGLEQLYGPEERAAALARKQVNPGIAGFSELAGVVGAGALASLLSGGAAAPAAAEGLGGAAARLVGKTVAAPWVAGEAAGTAAQRGVQALLGEGLAGRAVGLGAKGAVEGAIGGAGGQVSKAALEDVPLTSERLLSGAFEGAALGGLLTPAIGVLGHGVGRGLRAIRGNRTVQQAAGSMARKQALHTVGIESRDELGDMLGKELLANMKAGDTAGTVLERVGAARTATREAVDAIQTKVDDALRARPDLHPDLRGAVAKADELLDPLRKSSAPGIRAQAGQIDDRLAGLREVASGDPVKVRLADGTPSVAPREPLTFAQLEELHESVKLPKATSAEHARLFEKVERVIAEPFESTTKRVLGDGAKEYTALKDKLGRLDRIIAEAPAPGASGLAGAMGGLEMGTLLSAMTGNLGGVVAGGAAGIAKKLVQDRGSSVMAVMANKVAQSTTRVDAAARVAAMVDLPRTLPTPVTTNVARLFERYTKDLEQSDEEVADQLGRLTAGLDDYAPEMAHAVTQRALEDRAYLKSVAPVPTTNVNQTLTPKATKVTYSFDQKKAFVESAVALERPLSVFEDLARGEWPRQKIETIKERRPLLWDEMRTSVVRYTAQRDEELPYPRRMLLGVAFGFPSDWSMVNVGTIQESVAAPPEKAPTDPTAAPSKITDNPGAAIEPGGF